MKFSKITLLSSVFSVLFLASCSDVDIVSPAPVETASNLAATTEARNVTLTWTLPAGATGSRICRDAEVLADIDGPQTSYLVKRVDTGREVLFTVKARYADGRVSEGITIPVTVNYTAKSVPAFLSEFASPADVQDDDERAAAEWFMANVKDGKWLTPADLADGVYPDDYSCIWVMVDRVGLGCGWDRLPQGLISDQTLNALRGYLAEGGNMLLTNHATQMITPLGRTDQRYAPGIFGDGDGGDGDDIWVINAQIGAGMDRLYDHRQHPIFAGLKEFAGGEYLYEHATFPLIGPGHREDHNCMWDFNAYGFAPEHDTVEAFEKATNSQVLAAWGHVRDYACAGLIEFLPTPACPGRIIGIGLAAYEWNQNSGVNPYQDQIEKMTLNALNYLK